MTSEIIQTFREAGNLLTAQQRERDKDDLNHEMSGADNGRQKRFLASAITVNAKSEKEHQKLHTQLHMNALQTLLNDNPKYAAMYHSFSDLLSRAEIATEKALEHAIQESAEANKALQDIEDSANQLEDGTKVYKKADGTIVNEHGQEVSEDDAGGIVWKGDEPSYEDYKKAKQRAESAKQREQDIRTYQTDTLGRARDRVEDENNPITPAEIDRFEKDIREQTPELAANKIVRPDEVSVTQATPVVNTHIPDIGPSST